jgi:hypothetical protein
VAPPNPRPGFWRSQALQAALQKVQDEKTELGKELHELRISMRSGEGEFTSDGRCAVGRGGAFSCLASVPSCLVG